MEDADLEYHKRRATAELDRGLTSTHIVAARAHLALASMHMQRVRELSEPGARLEPVLRM